METDKKTKMSIEVNDAPAVELPFCTKAPSPEIKKSEEEEEPCKVF
jgi:hypothetical protein